MSTETYPHRKDTVANRYADCRCTAIAVHSVADGATWGSDCPAALRERVAELERATPGPHITHALMRRIEALGFTPGNGEPIGWLVAHAEELAATLANERGEGEPPSEGWAWIDGAWRRTDDNGGFAWSVHNFDPGRWQSHPMTPTLESLARQLAAAPKWDWPIGMVAVDPVGRRCWQRITADRWFCVETARVYRTAPAGLLPLLDYYTASALLLVLAREVSGCTGAVSLPVPAMKVAKFFARSLSAPSVTV